MLLTLILSASAANCDVKALQASFQAASPSSAGKVFADLAACDAATAKAFAPTAFQKILSGDGGNQAMLAAIAIGADDVVRNWVVNGEPNDRSEAIKTLGASCDKARVPVFFTDTAKNLGDKFWNDGWFSGLGSCRDPGVQELLRNQLSKPTSDRARFYNILSVFSKNLGKNAIPLLKSMIERETDAEISANLISAFADAAASDPEAKPLAISTIIELAPKLPTQAVNQARITLLSLGAESESDALAAVRYQSVRQASGGLMYGMLVVDDATCKKGDRRVEVHAVQVNEAGHTWPDQLAERVKPSAATIETTLASRCKGTGTVRIVVSEEPFANAAAFNAWVDTQLKAIEKDAGVAPKRLDEEPVAF
jgi:hypothetical protein